MARSIKFDNNTFVDVSGLSVANATLDRVLHVGITSLDVSCNSGYGSYLVLAFIQMLGARVIAINVNAGSVTIRDVANNVPWSDGNFSATYSNNVLTLNATTDSLFTVMSSV